MRASVQKTPCQGRGRGFESLRPLQKFQLLSEFRVRSLRYPASAQLAIGANSIALHFQATWTIPATRTKNRIPHLVPLSQPARELLHALPIDGPGDVQGARQRAKLALVFPGERRTPFSGWSKAKSALDAASGVSGWWLHDLRRTLATGLQRLGVRLEVTEAVLNHLSGSRAGVVGIYQRHDWAEEKRAGLDAWSAHLLAAAEGRLTAVQGVAIQPSALRRDVAESSIRRFRLGGATSSGTTGAPAED